LISKVYDSNLPHDAYLVLSALGSTGLSVCAADVPPEELEWSKGNLQGNTNPVVVFAHQRLDVTDSHGVKNAAAVRSILEASGNVSTVFQGHSHKNDLRSIKPKGFRNQLNRDFTKAS